MEKIGIWGASVCVFAVVIALFKALFPQGNIKKTGETVTVLLMLLVMLQPFTKMDLNSDALFPKNDPITFEAVQETEYYSNALAQVIRESLEQHGLTVGDIQPQAETDDAQYLVLTKLRLQTDAEAEEVYQCLEELGIPREIIEIEA